MHNKYKYVYFPDCQIQIQYIFQNVTYFTIFMPSLTTAHFTDPSVTLWIIAYLRVLIIQVYRPKCYVIYIYIVQNVYLTGICIKSLKYTDENTNAKFYTNLYYFSNIVKYKYEFHCISNINRLPYLQYYTDSAPSHVPCRLT